MNYFEAVLLGLLQAATEFLPVSSSGHLATFHYFYGQTIENITFDILVHLATLFAVLFYLREDLLRIVARLFLRSGKQERDLVLALLLGTIPAAVVGLSMKKTLTSFFFEPQVFATGFILTGTLLGLAHHRQTKSNLVQNGLSSPSLLIAFLIGLAQAFALVPGISRAGATVAAGLILGLRADAALRFSFLLSIPAVAGAAILELSQANISASNYSPYAVGFAVALIGGYFFLRLLVFFTQKSKLHYFSMYTLLLGLGIHLSLLYN